MPEHRDMNTDTAEVRLHLWDYWRVVSNRKALVFSIFSLVMVAAVITTLVLPKIYRATVMMEIIRESKDIEVFERNIKPDYDPFFQQTQFHNIQQKDVLYPVIERLQLSEKWAKRDDYEEPVYPKEVTYKLLVKSMDVRQVRNTSLIELRVENRSKEEGVQIAKLVSESYVEARLRQTTDQAKRGLDRLQEEVKREEEARSKAMNEVERLRRELGITELAGTGGLRASDATPLSQSILQKKEQDLSDAKIVLITKQKRLEQIKDLPTSELLNALTALNLKDDNLVSTQSEFNQAEALLTQYKKEGYGGNHPTVVAQENVVRKLKEQLEQQLGGMRQGLIADVVTEQAKVEQIEKDIQQYKTKSVEENSEKYSVFRDAVRRFETHQMVYDAAMGRYKQNLIESEMPSTPIIIRSPAEAWIKPVKPKWWLNLLLAFVVGSILGVSAAFFIEYLDTSVKTIDDVENRLKIPVLAVIPLGVPTLNKDIEDSPHAEGYRILRTKIESLRSSPTANTVTMVSGGPGEGKSTTLFNLAWTCAQSGMSTLLVDADLRRPSLHRVLEFQNDVGLSDYLSGAKGLSEVVHGTSLPSLHFVPSGNHPSLKSYLSSPRMKEFFEDVKSRYDWVFFDAPPILGVSDAGILARMVDATVMVIQHRRFPVSVTMRVKQSVVEIGGKLIGVVLNQVNTKEHEMYGYYNSYYDYYGKTDDKKSKGSKKTIRPAGQEY